MKRFICAFVFTLSSAALAGQVRAAEPKSPESEGFNGRVVVLKPVMTQPAGPVNPGSLIVIDIPDSGSRPPQNIKADGTTSTPMGHVRGVNTNDKGQSLMGGGYTWYLFKAPSGVKSTHIKVSYTPNGGDGKPVERDHEVLIESP